MENIIKDSPHKRIYIGVNELYQLLEKKALSQAHFLFLAVYVIAIRSGFVPQNVYLNKQIKLLPLQPWSAYDKRNVEICHNQKPSYEYNSPHETYFMENLITLVEKSEQNDNLKSMLTAIVTGDFMIITLTPHPSTKLVGRSSCLSIARYVISHSENQQSVEGCYQKLDQLELQLRNEVFMLVRNEQLSLVDAFPQPCLMGLPRELRFRIYRYLHHTKELAKLRLINKDILEEINRLDATLN
ncbi:protein nutcracker [Eurosta solidaginis]|uniref:protein nutcracker n=1 Tax=Eurosta solidaginis TaxID=178769 RepID=UPI0035306052